MFSFIPAYVLTWAWDSKYFYGHALLSIVIWLILSGILAATLERHHKNNTGT